MSQIIISPWAKVPRDGRFCAKNYPYWEKVVELLKPSYKIIQIGVNGEAKIKGCEQKFNLTMGELKSLLDSCVTWISVDNFFPHFAHYHGRKGIAIFGISDPKIFGYPENINLIRSRNNLRLDQWNMWDTETHNPKVFISAETVAENVNDILTK